MPQLPRDTHLYLAGHTGLVSSAIHRKLRAEHFTDVITRPRAELDLTDQAATRTYFERERPQVVTLVVARVGGILANSTCPADFLDENLTIALDILHAAHHTGVTKLLNLGSSCIYPRLAPQPIPETALFREIHEAKQSSARSVTIWGTGEVKCQFLHSDDLADAALFLLDTSANPAQ